MDAALHATLFLVGLAVAASVPAALVAVFAVRKLDRRLAALSGWIGDLSKRIGEVEKAVRHGLAVSETTQGGAPAGLQAIDSTISKLAIEIRTATRVAASNSEKIASLEKGNSPELTELFEIISRITGEKPVNLANAVWHLENHNRIKSRIDSEMGHQIEELTRNYMNSFNGRLDVMKKENERVLKAMQLIHEKYKALQSELPALKQVDVAQINLISAQDKIGFRDS